MKTVALGLAVIFFVVALLYLFGLLQVGTSEPGRHLKHFVLFAVLGVLALVWMRFASAPSVRR